MQTTGLLWLGQPGSTVRPGGAGHFSFQMMWESHNNCDFCVSVLALTLLRTAFWCAGQ